MINRISIDKNFFTYFLLSICIFLQIVTVTTFDFQALSLLAFVFFLSINQMPRYGRKYAISTLILLLFIFYCLLSWPFYDAPDNFEYLRLFRALVSTILLYLIFESGRFDRNIVFNIIISILLVHAVIIILELLFPVFHESVVKIINFQRPIVYSRATGLLKSYDAAGAFLVIGLILCGVMYKFTFNVRYIFLLNLFWVAGCGTGRSFMLVGSVFFVFYMWPYLFKTKIDFLKCLSILLILTVSFFTIMRYGSFLINSLSFSFFGEGSVLTNDLDIDGYYIGSLSVLQEHIILPKGLEELVFGNGSRLIESDIGYYKVINSFGLVGLFFYIAYIGATYFFTLNTTSVTERRLILIPILIVLIIYNSKMQVFLSRGYHEMYLIIILSMVNWRSNDDQSRLDFKLKG